jgi:hypothetical protein
MWTSLHQSLFEATVVILAAVGCLRLIGSSLRRVKHVDEGEEIVLIRDRRARRGGGKVRRWVAIRDRRGRKRP